MGTNFIANRINPELKIDSLSQLRNQPQEEVSRANFVLIEKIKTTGFNDESIIWLAQNISNSKQKFYIKQSFKKLLFQNNRIQSIHDELFLLTKEQNDHLVRPLYAFQDYQSLYIVFDYVECFTLEQVLREHIFTQQQAKSVIVSLIQIIQHFHQHKYAITQLCPKNIIIETKTGNLKLLELVNPIPIDSYYPSNMIGDLNLYSAPEVIAMDYVRTESDYYSLGLIMYEIMKGKKAISLETMKDRMSIINEEIQVEKSDLPQGWKPEATNFLIKLIIKNAQLRLGKYGSFEVRTDPWLQNCTWTQNQHLSRINLHQPYFQQKSHEKLPQTQKDLDEDFLLNQYEFQSLFEGYEFKFKEIKEQSVAIDSIIQEQF